MPEYQSILFAIAAYVIGSIPFGKIIAGSVARIDITQRGSGNIGATNVARELGMKWGIITLVLDVLKGLAPVLIFSLYVSRTGAPYETALAAIGLCALLGHMFPVFLKFRGGKGVATALGVYLAISPLSCLCGLVLFVLIVIKWDFISLGSVISAGAMPLFLILFGKPQPVIIASLIMALLICYKHKENIQRLIKGEERKWKERNVQANRSSNLSNSSSE
ncbi:MAG: glycerol-3-phosphate 1-O-acyltransferase PlsY [Proteobacteria bacterium]|nr:glycerol-3-phosphate 1-O-acyltransferase PlsY [Pseudomonadota bacterium]MBU0990036.1 glycerol-3-phosphate 1-O-acyltransferase PlsY [Pseudomonadota bacterium]MBU1905301.1 glycerol-3-phosphate 1-O-acyltransferase PlsY [Pseudomonadota bacterium]